MDAPGRTLALAAGLGAVSEIDGEPEGQETLAPDGRPLWMLLPQRPEWEGLRWAKASKAPGHFCQFNDDPEHIRSDYQLVVIPEKPVLTGRACGKCYPKATGLRDSRKAYEEWQRNKAAESERAAMKAHRAGTPKYTSWE